MVQQPAPMIQTGSNKELRIAIPGIMPGQTGQTGMVCFHIFLAGNLKWSDTYFSIKFNLLKYLQASTPVSAGGFNGASSEVVSKLNLQLIQVLNQLGKTIY